MAPQLLTNIISHEAPKGERAKTARCPPVPTTFELSFSGPYWDVASAVARASPSSTLLATSSSSAFESYDAVLDGIDHAAHLPGFA